MTTAFVAGSTGTLGTLIIDSLRRRDVQVRTLVRASNTEGRRRLEERSGVDVVVGAIGDSADTLVPALEGADIVISAVQGDPEVLIEGQANLARAAEKAGVPRWIPSDFSYDLYKVDDGDNAFSDIRRKAASAYDDITVRPTSVLPGAFLESVSQPYFEVVDWEAGTFSYWGDGDEPIEFTSYADTAEFTAEVALDPQAGRFVRIAGNVLTWLELHQALNRASGRRLELRRLGSIGDLEKEVEQRKVGSTNVFDYLAKQYFWVMSTGKARLEPLENHRYPGVTPTGAEEFYRQNLSL